MEHPPANLSADDTKLLLEVVDAGRLRKRMHQGKLWYYRPSDEKHFPAHRPDKLMAAVKQEIEAMHSQGGKSPRAAACSSPKEKREKLPELRSEEAVARERALELAELQRQVLDLEVRRDTLAESIALLEAPVLSEARAVKDLRRRVLQSELELKKLKQDNIAARELHEARRRMLTARVAELEREVQAQQDDHKDQEEQLHGLKQGKLDMQREMEAERDRVGELEQEKAGALRQIDTCRRQQQKLEEQARSTGNLLREVSTSARDALLQEQTMRHNCAELSQTAERLRRQVADVKATLASRGEHSELRREYERKLKLWSSLEAPARMQEDIVFLRREARSLMHNRDRAQQEAAALGDAAALLRAEADRACIAAEGLSRENASLTAAVAALTADAHHLLEEEEQAALMGDGSDSSCASLTGEEEEEEADDDDEQDVGTPQKGPMPPAYMAALEEYNRLNGA
eukprot:TRINITY_DN19865_c0_g1_i2.p1 TRINITY_DN19865_c0_g1~~TRINITY_DN19865_c0_g1_i2.p1  ORF type:complete len:460 (+),score=157.30 TRINITY_DN19865_c0_g1_i2:47-1426(+)